MASYTLPAAERDRWPMGKPLFQVPGRPAIACAVPKLVSELVNRRPRSLGRSAIFADQATEDLPALDPGSDVNGAAGMPRRFLLQALVRAMSVVVAGELGQDLAEMLLAEDQDVIEALAAKRADEPLRV